MRFPVIFRRLIRHELKLLAVRPEPFNPVRPELVEGRNDAQDRLGKGSVAIHVSTSSTRTASFLIRTIFFACFLLPLTAHAAKNILVFGDSLSAGYGITIEKSWVNLLQQELLRTQSGFSVVNASISGETTTGGRQRSAHALKQFRPVIVIVELGANDGMRGAPIKDIEANLGYIIEQSQSSGAKVLLAGMKLPPNYGEPYITQFANVYPRLAKKHGILILPFLLEGVAADQFQADNLHPVAEAQQRIMLNVMQELKHLLH
jgi:acyl-CoA thioesterase-1